MWISLVALGLVALAAGVTLAVVRRRSGPRSRFRSAVHEELTQRAGQARADETPVTDSDLRHLPPIVATYLRRAGAIGRPRVTSFRATFRAAFCGGPEQPWMRGTAEQYGFFGPAVRLFRMSLRRFGIPVDVYHRFQPGAAIIQARALGLFDVAAESGDVLVRSETVTVLNDMFLLAPATLIDAPIEWQALTSHMVRATLTNAGHTVSAIVWFDESGDIVDFESDDRYFIDGETRCLKRWSTPVIRHCDVDGMRLFAEAEARWTEADGRQWTYARFELTGIEYNAGD
jgi:hypothetical protein